MRKEGRRRKGREGGGGGGGEGGGQEEEEEFPDVEDDSLVCVFSPMIVWRITRRRNVTSSRGGQKGDLQIQNINPAV